MATSPGSERSPALYGWAGIAAVVIAYDAWALFTGQETLSGYYERVTRSKKARLLAINALWGGLWWHLARGDMQILPPAAQARYRRIHPLWVLHDAVIARANSRVVAVSGIPVWPSGTPGQPTLARNLLYHGDA